MVFTAVTAVTMPTVATAGGKPASAEPTPFSYMSPDVRAKMLAQQPIKAAASRIQRTIDSADSAGFAGVGIGEGHVTVWWKGNPPAAVQDTIAEVRRTAKVDLVAAAHSRAELTAAAGQVKQYIKANPKSPYYGVEIAYNGSGLTVDADKADGKLSAAALPSALAVPAGIRVNVTESARPTLTTGRLNDTAPYWGGGRIQSNDGGWYCTAGFPVSDGGISYMLTAGHCGRPNGSWNNGDDSAYFGTGRYENPKHDILLIYASVGGRMWDGGVGSGEFSKGVAGSDYNFPGEMLCTSGSTTGALCNFRTGENFQFSYCYTDDYGNYECYDDLLLADQLDGRPGSQGGDSGGPVFSLSGTDHVIAEGTISGVRGSQLIFQDFLTAQRDFGIHVITG
ncbi:hypothetical protein [Actinocrispum sp. NPDC049592]|uniref:hypothetical protein n=1 Tax=Actinocrispum sp. NPDC049592 TaxID=3154835 RepID=UPI0034408440